MTRKNEASVDIKDEARLHGADEKRTSKEAARVEKPKADEPTEYPPYPILSNDPKPGRLASLPLGHRNR